MKESGNSLSSQCAPTLTAAVDVIFILSITVIECIINVLNKEAINYQFESFKTSNYKYGDN